MQSNPQPETRPALYKSPSNLKPTLLWGSSHHSFASRAAAAEPFYGDLAWGFFSAPAPLPGSRARQSWPINEGGMSFSTALPTQLCWQNHAVVQASRGGASCRGSKQKILIRPPSSAMHRLLDKLTLPFCFHRKGTKRWL